MCAVQKDYLIYRLLDSYVYFFLNVLLFLLFLLLVLSILTILLLFLIDIIITIYHDTCM